MNKLETNGSLFRRELRIAIRKLLSYCQENDWAGYDPYDALNSRLFQALPFLNFPFPRLVLTQALKRNPINIRSILFVPKTQNPKGLALFLSAFVLLSKSGEIDAKPLMGAMLERLIALRSANTAYWCWGYSFPWQMRKGIVPVGAPNLVCTTFVANALLDSYDECQDPRCLEMALSAAEYIEKELYWTSGNSVASFSYPLPSNRIPVHNANFLAASLLCRAYRKTQRQEFLVPAIKATRYSVKEQRPNGSWVYGTSDSQQWVDNFHTGYNLCALQSIARNAETTEFDEQIQRGFVFYREHFFREDGAARYFHNRTYPIDSHSVAQSIITLLAFQNLEGGGAPQASAVLQWAMEHMWDERGYFYYRKLRLGTIRTSYMRWSQAWMFLAIVHLYCALGTNKTDALFNQGLTSSSLELTTKAEAR